MFYSLFVYGIIDWICKNIPAKNGRGQMGKSTYAMGGGRGKRICAYDGASSQMFAIFMR